MSVGTKLVSGFTEVATEQKAVQLTTSSETCVAILISVPASNTGTLVAVGGSKTTTEAKKTLGSEKGVILEKGKGTVLRLDAIDPTSVWVDVEKGKDGVSWTLIQA